METTLPTLSPHIHAWRITEVGYDDCLPVRLFECACGQIDYTAAA